MRRGFALVAALGSLACASSRPASEAASSSESTTEATSSSEATTEPGTSETGDQTSTETETGEDPDPGLTECPTVEPAQTLGTVSSPEIDETSGMVRSRTQELLWVHNDSGDSARLFAISLDGSALAELELAGAGALDWEDLALGPGPAAGDWLYVGDIGDNAEARPGITVYRFPEPAEVAQIGADPLVIGDWQALELSYPDAPHNAETLLVDPVGGDLFIVSKGAQTLLFRRPAPLSSGELEQLPEPNFPSSVATAGDISPLGDFVIVRGYFDAFAWLRAPGQTIGEAMLGEPCPIPLAVETQ
ncbi:MAG TPA: hypothetical protein VK034_26420, partial [Enhygromyxa sp.]|nr:hypothetical protein [Enhygromyxa sp.]